MLICMPMIAIKKWKSRNHPVPLSNIRTNSRNNETSSGGNSFELNAISVIYDPPTSSDESNEQLPNGKLCLLKVSKSLKQIPKFSFEPKNIFFKFLP